MPINTDYILKQSPFYLKKQQLAEFMQLAQDLDLTLDPFLFGTFYKKECAENPEPYTEDEITNVVLELDRIYEINFAGVKPSEKPTYDFTLGAPGTGKSAFTEVNLVGKNVIYLDPDRQILRSMSTYKELVAEKGGKLAYETCRDTSNYICNLLLVWAIYKGYSIVHGTTGTNPRVAKSILPTLKKLGYKVNAHVLFAPAASRDLALEHRIHVQDFYQVTALDQKGKVGPVFDRLMDAVLVYADNADMYLNMGKYWLNSTPEQNKKSWCKFAVLKRTGENVDIVGVKDCPDVLAELILQVKQEIRDPFKQQQLIALFQGWLKHPETVRSFLPAFNRNAAIVATLSVGFIAAFLATEQGHAAIQYLKLNRT